MPAADPDVMAAGEGIETMVSLRTVMPALPMVAGALGRHLGALLLPPRLAPPLHRRRRDAAGRHGIERLSRRAGEAGILALALRPLLGDFNDDLRRLGPMRSVSRPGCRSARRRATPPVS